MSSSSSSHPPSPTAAFLAGQLRGYETQASVLEALSGRTSWTPTQMKAILLNYCENKLSSTGGAGRVHASDKLSIIEQQLSKNVHFKRRPMLHGLVEVFIDVRYELGLRRSPVFRPPAAPGSTRVLYRAPESAREPEFAPPPAWTPRMDDPPPTVVAPVRVSSSEEDDDLTRAMRESLLVGPTSSSEVVDAASSSPLPLPRSPPPPRQAQPLPSSSSTRPTFRSTFLSLPLPTLDSPTLTSNDPLNILTSANYRTLFLIDDSPTLDWKVAKDALSKLVPLVSLLQPTCSSEVAFVRAEELGGGRCETEGELRGLMASADVDGLETGRLERGAGLGRRLEGILEDRLEFWEEEREERMRSRRGGRKEGGSARGGQNASSSGTTSRPLIVIVLTDGTSSDDLESVLVSASKRLDRLNAPQGQLGVFFLQLGTDPLAREYLRSLSKLTATHPSLGREIADSTSWTLPSPASTSSGVPVGSLGEEGRVEEAVLLRKILLGSINRRVAEVDL